MQKNKEKNSQFSPKGTSGEISKKIIKVPYARKDLSKDIKKKKNDIFLLHKINNIISERNLLQPDQKILIAVSGGQDSICMLRVLSQLTKKWNWTLGIIHCDHRWNFNSQYQAEFVACLAGNLQINYHEAIAIESVQKEGIARIWRYRTIKTIAISNNYTAIITGHNASDRIETLLYNLTRGSGLHGLQSIKWRRYLFFFHLTQSVICRKKFSFFFQKLKYIKQNLSLNVNTKSIFQKDLPEKSYFLIFQKKLSLFLIRPFLDTTRAEIRNIMTFWNFPSWPDETNKELQIKRNRIRHRLIPYIRVHYNPNVDQILVRLAEIVQSETLYLEQLTNYLISKIEIKKRITDISFFNKSFVEVKREFSKANFPDVSLGNFYQSAIPIDLLRSLPLAIQRRVLKQYIYRNTSRILGFHYIEQIRLSFLFYRRDLITDFRYQDQDQRFYLSNQILSHSSNLTILGSVSELKDPKEKKNNYENVHWMIFPNGIKLLIRKNYLFLFFDYHIPFSKHKEKSKE